MTLGASTMAPAVAAAIIPPAVTMNLRRSVIALPSSPGDELVVGTFGHAIPEPCRRVLLGDHVGSVNDGGGGRGRAPGLAPHL
jgi:hypothetical protein